MRPKSSKYGNRKTKALGITFDSKRESVRYVQLKAMEQRGLIRSLELQKRFELVPSQRRSDGKPERPVHYVADFVYRRAGLVVVEDSKGVKTSDYVIKRKLMLEKHGISVVEV